MLIFFLTGTVVGAIDQFAQDYSIPKGSLLFAFSPLISLDLTPFRC